jgi:hypothetical protein
MSINTYKNVLLIGVAGTVGKNILLDLLVDSNFNISILSRTDSIATFSSDVNVIKVDYSNQTALIKALIKQNVVISAVGGEAAIEANVKWIIPSQFGSDLTNSFAATLPIKPIKRPMLNYSNRNSYELLILSSQLILFLIRTLTAVF